MTKNTVLYDEHIKLKAKMVEFAGWQMPILYNSVIEEHKSVRSACGIFDVSHMGCFEFTGEKPLDCVQYLTTNNVKNLTNNQAQYSMFLNERGTIIDDIIVYRINEKRILIVVNASNEKKDFNWVINNKTGNVEVKNIHDQLALIAVQGPETAGIMKKISDIKIDNIETFHMGAGTVAGIENCILARTGYTGEDGFEIFAPKDGAVKIWNSLLENGAKPIGLGARDTLRLEMKYTLYGHEISDETNPIEAGIGWAVKLDTDDFIGKSAILKIKEEGLKRKLVGFEMIDRSIPRDGYPIVIDDKPQGSVTSGTMSPSLNKGIGIGYVPKEFAKVGTEFSIDIRGRLRLAKVIKTPFYKREVAQ